MIEINPHFYHFLAEGNILCDCKAKNSEELIRELGTLLCHNTAGLNTEDVIREVIEREKVVPTVIAPGLAVPHARMADVKQLLVALATSRAGIDFNSPGMPPVKVAIMILTPKDDPGLHLQILSALARDFQDADAIEKVSLLSSPAEVIKNFNDSDSQIPDYLRAGDLMNTDPVCLKESNTLSEAIALFVKTNAEVIPVLDNDNDLRGTVAFEDILRFSLPDHILWLDDLSPILRFEPFADMLQDENETRLADFMNEETVSVAADTPAIQLGKIFLMRKVRQILVTDGSRLLGTVDMQNFCTKLFWE